MRAERGPSAGFTLIEMLVVVLVIGIGMALVLPNLDRLTPRHRLRSSAREIASTMELARHMAITKVATYGIRYEVEPPGGFTVPSYRLLLPADEAGDREALSRRRLPDGVFIRAVVLPGGEELSTGEAVIDFGSSGNDGAHVVILENEEGDVLSIKFQPLVGLATFYDEEVGFAEFRGSF